eukprot:1540054-Rhodomonas_salina.2
MITICIRLMRREEWGWKREGKEERNRQGKRREGTGGDRRTGTQRREEARGGAGGRQGGREVGRQGERKWRRGSCWERETLSDRQRTRRGHTTEPSRHPTFQTFEASTSLSPTSTVTWG